MNQPYFYIWGVPIDRKALVHDFLLSGIIPEIIGVCILGLAIQLYLQKSRARSEQKNLPRKMAQQADEVADELERRGVE